MARRVVEFPIGPLAVRTTSLGVAGVGWEMDVVDAESSKASLLLLDRAIEELDEYFAGGRRCFDVPVDRSPRRGFRGEVLDALESVPYGATLTYGELAVRAGRPRAARAVGTSMATNPVAVIVPCHRVLPAGGGVGNYGGGVDVKRLLLRLEGSLGGSNDD
jgi:methylated-DNA-[protein]-cysteine S-methyltransferase